MAGESAWLPAERVSALSLAGAADRSGRQASESEEQWLPEGRERCSNGLGCPLSDEVHFLTVSGAPTSGQAVARECTPRLTLGDGLQESHPRRLLERKGLVQREPGPAAEDAASSGTETSAPTAPMRSHFWFGSAREPARAAPPAQAAAACVDGRPRNRQAVAAVQDHGRDVLRREHAGAVARADHRLHERDYVALPHQNPGHWDMVTRALASANSPTTCDGLRQAITAYNVHACQCNFRPLEMALQDKSFGPRSFFSALLPGIIKMALALPSLFPKPLRLLEHSKGSSNETCSLTRRQLASLLANMFLCTFERHKASWREGPRLSGVDCLALFGCVENMTEDFVCHNAEKLKCLLHYFRKTQQRWDDVDADRQAASAGCDEGGEAALQRRGKWGAYLEQRVEFARRMSPTVHLDWRRSEKMISNIELSVFEVGKIEDVEPGIWEADFANAYIGGGVLGRGCVQEEIRFLLSPELIAGRLYNSWMTCTCAIARGSCPPARTYMPAKSCE